MQPDGADSRRKEEDALLKPERRRQNRQLPALRLLPRAKEAVAVKELLRLIKGLNRTNGGIGEGHRGILLARDYCTP